MLTINVVAFSPPFKSLLIPKNRTKIDDVKGKIIQSIRN